MAELDFLKNRYEVEIGEHGIKRLYMDFSNLLFRGWEYYIGLIVALRIELVRDRGMFVHGKPKLNPTMSIKRAENFFDLVLIALEGARIEVRFLIKNLYLIGVRVPGRPWNELDFDGTRYIEGEDVEVIPFRGDYASLRQREEMGNILTGFESLKSAVRVLGSFFGRRCIWTDRSKKSIGHALMTITVTISESCRFRIIGMHILNGVRNRHDPFPIPEWMSKLILEWGTLSGIWCRKDGEDHDKALEELKKRKLEFPNGKKIETFDDLEEVIGILKDVSRQSEESKCERVKSNMKKVEATGQGAKIANKWEGCSSSRTTETKKLERGEKSGRKGRTKRRLEGSVVEEKGIKRHRIL